jgi:hypothetical protein
MDALKIIPQAFFDAIARVVPGVLTLLLLAWLEPAIWKNVANATAVAISGDTDKPSSVGLLIVAYMLGHLMSPGTKLVQRITERYPRVRGKEDPPTLSPQPMTQKICRILHSWTSVNTEDEAKSLKPNSKHYDWLRVKSPDAGGLAAKLRAEFTMYNSIAFVALAFAALSAFSCDNRWLVFGLFGIGLLMAARGRETQKTMRDAVENFYAAASGPPP